MRKKFTSYTDKEVALVLMLADDETDGTDISSEMLKGITRFSQSELQKLADYKNVTIDELIWFDEQFKIYRNPIEQVRKEIAANLIKKGYDAQLAAEVCDLPLDKVM